MLLFTPQISDWTGNTYQDRRFMNKYNSQFGAGGTQYAYYHEEDESTFQLVDTSRTFRYLWQITDLAQFDFRLLLIWGTFIVLYYYWIMLNLHINLLVSGLNTDVEGSSVVAEVETSEATIVGTIARTRTTKVWVSFRCWLRRKRTKRGKKLTTHLQQL